MKRIIKKENIFTITWVVIYLTVALQLLSRTPVGEALLFPLFFCVLSYPIARYLTLNLQKVIQKKRKLLFVVLFIACSLAIAVIGYVDIIIFHYLETLGYFPLSQAFSIQGSQFAFFFNLFVSFGVGFNLYFFSLGFYLAYSNLEKEHLEAQLKMLQAQITPHFMFNVLHQVNMLMQKDVDAASELLINYSDILRYQLYSGKEEYVPMGQEVKFLKEFIYVEETRWKGKLNVKCTWNIENTDCKVPPSLLIVLIENAFKHVSHSGSEKGFVDIKLKQEGNNLRLDVDNSKSLIPPSKKDKGSGIGLENIESRLNILYPGKHNLAFIETDSAFSSKLEIKL